MPQALPLLPAWADNAVEQGLITPDEAVLIKDFVTNADKVIQVDDFAPDFGAAEGIAAKNAYFAPSEITRQAAE